ncbi:MAG TPA: hypothetical protein VHX13_14120 [Acidobacteriaceae bacterium]|nr:hypothetical protein [Acidobacteriaceae bacterium]
MESREEVRELAEALSLYRSAMTHVAERSVAHPRVAVQRSTAPFRLRLLVGPALGAALAAGILFPLYGHVHHRGAVVLQSENTAAPDPASARASVDDTVLMNQIDSQLSETVPDALEPLADLSAQATTQSPVTEKKQ